MQQHIGEVVAGGAGAVPLHIEHVRNPCEWMLVCRWIMGAERPCDLWPGQSLQTVRIARDIVRIVVIDKAVPQRGRVKYTRADRQQHRHQKNEPPVALHCGTQRSGIEIVCRSQGCGKLHRGTQTAGHEGTAQALLVRPVESDEVGTDSIVADLSTSDIRFRRSDRPSWLPTAPGRKRGPLPCT